MISGNYLSEHADEAKAILMAAKIISVPWDVVKGVQTSSLFMFFLHDLNYFQALNQSRNLISIRCSTVTWRALSATPSKSTTFCSRTSANGRIKSLRARPLKSSTATSHRNTLDTAMWRIITSKQRFTINSTRSKFPHYAYQLLTIRSSRWTVS